MATAHNLEKGFFKFLFEPFAKSLAQFIVDSEQVKGRLNPSEKQLEKKSQEILKEIQNLIEIQTQTLLAGFDVLARELTTFVTPQQRTDIALEIDRALIEMSLHSSILKEKDAKEHSLQEKLKISAETMEQFYRIGCKLCHDNHYLEAGQVFSVLTFLNAFNYAYWIALGIAHHNARSYEDAVNAFAMAAITNPKLPESRLYAAESYYQLGQLENARLEFEEALKIFEDEKMSHLWQDHLASLKQRLSLS